MSFDVFISYPHQDKTIADAACAALEAQDIRCWIAPRDIAPGADWAGSIVEAIDNCRAMVLIFSAHSNGSKQVYREVQQAFDGDKPVVPFRIENVTPAPTLLFVVEGRKGFHFLEGLPVVIVNPEIKRVVPHHPEHNPVAEHAGLAEHAPHGDEAERGELL